MKKYNRFLNRGTIAALVVYLIALYVCKPYNHPRFDRIIVPAAVFALFLASFVNARVKARFLHVALLWACIGDAVLKWGGGYAFTGVFAFFLTHCYLFAFYTQIRGCRRPVSAGKNSVYLFIPVLLAGLMFYGYIYNSSSDTALKIMLPFYLAALSLMCWRGLSVLLYAMPRGDQIRISAASALFYLTDLSVFLQQIHTEGPVYEALIVASWFLYGPALILLSSSGKRMRTLWPPAARKKAAVRRKAPRSSLKREGGKSRLALPCSINGAACLASRESAPRRSRR